MINTDLSKIPELFFQFLINSQIIINNGSDMMDSSRMILTFDFFIFKLIQIFTVSSQFFNSFLDNLSDIWCFGKEDSIKKFGVYFKNYLMVQVIFLVLVPFYTLWYFYTLYYLWKSSTHSHQFCCALETVWGWFVSFWHWTDQHI